MTDVSIESLKSFYFTYENIKNYLGTQNRERALRNYICLKARTEDLAKAIDIIAETVGSFFLRLILG